MDPVQVLSSQRWGNTHGARLRDTVNEDQGIWFGGSGCRGQLLNVRLISKELPAIPIRDIFPADVEKLSGMWSVRWFRCCLSYSR